MALAGAHNSGVVRVRISVTLAGFSAVDQQTFTDQLMLLSKG